MELLWLVIIGAIVGYLGRLVAGRDVNIVATILVGIVGTWLGFYLWGLAGGGGALMGYVIGVLVAAVFVSLLGGISRGRVARR